MLTKILSAAFIFFAVISVLPGIIKARKRYWLECVSRLIIIISSAFLSAWLTSIISMKLSELLLSLLESSLSNTTLDGILTEIPSAQKVFIAIVAFAIANLIFFLLYTILKAILKAIFTKPLTKLFLLIGGAIMRKDYLRRVYPKKSKKNKKKKKAEALVEENNTEDAPQSAEVIEKAEPKTRKETKEKKKETRKTRFGRWNFPKAALFGALCGFATYIIILVPIVASLELSAHMTNLIFPEGISSEMTENVSDFLPAELSENVSGMVSELPDALVENAGTKTVMTVGGRQLYNLYATVTVDGEKVSFDNEITFVVDIVEGVAAIADKDLSAKEKGDAIRSTTEHIDDTVIIPSILSEFINEAGEDWIAGRKFHNISCPSLGEGSEDMVVSLLKCLQGSTAGTIKEDLKSIVDIIAIIAENPTDGSVDFAKILSNKDLVSQISVEVLENERLAPMIKHLMVLNLGSEVPTINVTLPDENDPNYEVFIDQVITGYMDNVSVGNTSETLENIAGAVNQALVDHNIELEEGIDTVVAAALISEFGDGKELTSESLKAFISENITKYTNPQNNEATA